MAVLRLIMRKLGHLGLMNSNDGGRIEINLSKAGLEPEHNGHEIGEHTWLNLTLMRIAEIGLVVDGGSTAVKIGGKEVASMRL
ncbi:hypothetical protein Pint_14390 [Pistacia integerrima]|uniref:Uncharacterized protein n=1 Tax=Pistacia integerrima TaxID=434235 RepID=A0ACC0Y6M4_9ROSI|nr:hypothetical protein Pint_14390 [Pistacia integerrima]